MLAGCLARKSASGRGHRVVITDDERLVFVEAGFVGAVSEEKSRLHDSVSANSVGSSRPVPVGHSFAKLWAPGVPTWILSMLKAASAQ